MKPRRIAIALFGVLAILSATIAFSHGWLALGGASRPPVGRVRPADLAPALREGATTIVTVPAPTTDPGPTTDPAPTTDPGHDRDHDGDDD